MDWDKSFDVNEELSEWANKNTQVVRVIPKPVAGVNQREFYEKKLWFTSESGDIYIWVSSIPDELYSAIPSSVRCHTLCGFNRISKIKDGPGYFLSSIVQTDLKLTPWITNMAMRVISIQMEPWVTEFRKYVIERQKW